MMPSNREVTLWRFRDFPDWQSRYICSTNAVKVIITDEWVVFEFDGIEWPSITWEER